MSLFRLALLGASLLLFTACASQSDRGTIGQLKDTKIELKDEPIEGGIEKAMAGYKKFLEETPASAKTPEAIRRLADLKIEKQYGLAEGAGKGKTAPAADTIERQQGFTAQSAVAAGTGEDKTKGKGKNKQVDGKRESTTDFEKRATQSGEIKETQGAGAIAAPDGADLENADAREAIALYKELLEKYPLYERNDQVLYQMSRAYEELGELDQAMVVMNRIVKEYPTSRYIDEVQFRRGEYYFTRKKYLDAEGAYKFIADMGSSSSYYELALYKLGWSLYKQGMYEEGLHSFIALLDHKVKSGYDFENSKDDFEQKRIEDTYRVISLSFSYLGGPDAIADYFNKYGARSYEVDIYKNLGEHYLEKRRYADAAAAYKKFVKLNPYHKVSPHFDMRVIDIYKKGGFPRLVIDANKEFATNYGLKSEYWKHFDVNAYPDVLGYLKTNLIELANYYHTLYQDKKFEKDRDANFQEAHHWYREFLDSFPKDVQSPVMNFQLAELLLENKWYGQAATEFEHTAYDYPPHEKAPEAGFTAVVAHRKNLEAAPQPDRVTVKRDTIRSSLRFADTFPQHPKAALVMSAALEDIYGMKDYQLAVVTGRKLIANFPNAEQPLRRSAWLVVAHSSYELTNYKDAEEGYVNVLQLTAQDDASRAGLVENLAASIYKQGEQANLQKDYTAAAAHFLRVGQLAPTSKIRPAADYDAATALIQLKEWDRSAEVLLSFRKNYPDHQLQPDVTKKIAYVYQQSDKLALAAAEYERIEKESKDDEIRREALQVAADLYTKANEQEKALQVYRRYVGYFPHPVELALETRQKIADILKTRNDMTGYHNELKQIVDGDAKAGAERTDRTRYLAASAALVLTEPLYAQYAEIKLTLPFDKSLQKKKLSMKAANEAFGKLVKYEVGEVTAAATYYIAELYFNFSDSLKKSERPGKLSELEMEQYEEALDEQSYPFEEKAIQIHEKNLDFLKLGIYNGWIDKSLARLATLMPGRYAKFEESSGFIESIDTASYTALTDKPVVVEPVPAPAAVQAQPAGAAAPAETPAPADGTAPAEGATPVDASAATATPVVPANAPLPAATVAPVEAAKPAATAVPAEGATPDAAPAPAAPATAAPQSAPAADVNVPSSSGPAAPAEPSNPSTAPAQEGAGTDKPVEVNP